MDEVNDLLDDNRDDVEILVDTVELQVHWRDGIFSRCTEKVVHCLMIMMVIVHRDYRCFPLLLGHPVISRAAAEVHYDDDNNNVENVDVAIQL